jgi:uncharacterized membrane protein YhaH (DUF805 family)
MNKSSPVDNQIKPTQIKHKKDIVFLVRGRFSRSSFLAWCFLLYFPFFVAIILYFEMMTIMINESDFINVTSGFAQSYATVEQEGLSLGLLSLVLIFSFFIVNIIFLIRRLHDINLSGWLSILILLPIALAIGRVYYYPFIHDLPVRIGLLLTLGFLLFVMAKKGTQGINKFGVVRTTPKWEKTIGIIALLLIITYVVFLIVL